MNQKTTFEEAFAAVKKFRTKKDGPASEILFWETAWKKAAASGGITWPQEIISYKGTYKIEILQNEEDENKGIIILTVLKDKKKLEGKTINISDGKGNKLLEDKIKDSRAYNSDLTLNNIDLKLLVNTID